MSKVRRMYRRILLAVIFAAGGTWAFFTYLPGLRACSSLEKAAGHLPTEPAPLAADHDAPGAPARKTENAVDLAVPGSARPPANPEPQQATPDGAAAAVPAEPAATSELKALVWEEGSNGERARQALAEIAKETKILSEVVILADGFPRLLDSSLVQGIGPTEQVAALGICNEKELAGVLPVLQALRAGITTRPAHQDSLRRSCVTVREGYEITQTERLRAPSGELVAIELIGADRSHVPLQWKDLFILRNSQGELLDSVALDESYGVATGCDSALQKGRRGAMTVTLRCERPGPDDPLMRRTTHKIQFFVKEDKIANDLASPREEQ